MADSGHNGVSVLVVQVVVDRRRRNAVGSAERVGETALVDNQHWRRVADSGRTVAEFVGDHRLHNLVGSAELPVGTDHAVEE